MIAVVVILVVVLLFLLGLGIFRALLAGSPGAHNDHLRRSRRAMVDRRVVGRSHRATIPVMVVMRRRDEKIGIPHPVSAVIFGVPTIKGTIMTHTVLHNEDARKDDFVTRDDCHRATVGYRLVVRGGNNTA